MTQKEELGKENLDEVERWCSKLALALLGRVSQARVCWDGDPTLRAESLGEAPFHPSCPPRLGRSLCTPRKELRTSVLSFAPWHNQRCDRVPTTKSPAPNRHISQKTTNCITFGMGSGFPSYLCPAPAPWLCQQSLDLLWDGDTSSPHAEPDTRNRAQPTAQTHGARSSPAPVTSPCGAEWPLPSPQVVSRSPSATQGHPKPVTHRGPQHSPVSTSATPKLPTAPPTFAPLPKGSPPHPFLPPQTTLNT